MTVVTFLLYVWGVVLFVVACVGLALLGYAVWGWWRDRDAAS